MSYDTEFDVCIRAAVPWLHDTSYCMINIKILIFLGNKCTLCPGQK